MRIGVIGTGNMGRTLGAAWSRLGHDVMFGARDQAKALAARAYASPSARAGSNDDAAKFGEIIVWNPRVFEVGEVISDPSLLAGKTVIDMNDGPVPADFRFPHVPVSFAERLASRLPEAKVVKAFNTIAQEVFEHPADVVRRYGVSVFLASDHADAKATVAALASQLGFVPIDAGGLERAGMLESLADFIRYMMIGMGRGVFATISIADLPEVLEYRFGGRGPTNLP